MSETVAWHFKASLSCHFPSYTVDSREVLRALPVHLLDGGRNLYIPRAVTDSLSDRGCWNQVQPYAPKTPSPLRQSATRLMVKTKADNCVGCAEDAEDGNYLNNIGLLCISKRGAAEPRRPQSGLNLSHFVQTRSRKIAYTFAIFIERPRQARKVAQSFASPARASLADITRDIRPEEDICGKPLEFKHAADEISALRKELAGTRDQVRALHDRFARLEQAERRSASVQKRVQDQQDRLENVFEAFIDEGKERRTEMRLRLRRT